MEPWSADDPWQERRDPSAGWDEWPQQAPASDEYSLDEPEPPASDPWAESWTDEVPGIPTSPVEARDRDADRATDAAPEPAPAADLEAPFPEPEPMPAAEPEPAAIPEPEPTAFEAPRIEPWLPDPDPWGATWTLPPVVAEPAAEALDEPATDAAEEPTGEALEEPSEGPEAEPVAVVDVTPEVEPIGADALEAPSPEPEAEPSAQPEAEPSAQPELEAEAELIHERIAELPVEPVTEPIAEADVIGEPGPPIAAEPPTQEDWETLEPDPEPALWAGPAETATVDTNGGQPSAEPAPAWDAWAADFERVAEPEPTFPTPLWEEPSTSEAEDETGAEATEPDATWEADLWAEPEAEPTAAEPTEPEPIEPEPPEAAAVSLAEPPPSAEPAPETPWRERIDPTEVLPTTWAPPPPPATSEDGGIEPSRGAVRTSLGRAEPDVEDELAEEVTTAEQAVPWLIGVILLLAGMVIVLLALIFAGDASLGGGAGESPSQSPAALVPSGSGLPSSSPSPTARPSPSPSASASAQPAQPPEYGDLEMVYQGRSAALEPIYLLRRDFTLEGEADVVTQDADLDVRRFAWSADGTRGAALYADVLIGIDPGEAVRHLTEGISAITFGDDAKTIYAVRVTADGGSDVAVILAVNQQTGAEQELDRVRYRRPSIGEEAVLAEAQFTDDGGSIRLFWMHDDRLRLWILGGGAWTIHPTEGRATKLDEAALPVLWAPDGERRIRLAYEGGTTKIRMVDRSGEVLARASVEGRVSHVRWSSRGDQVVFTLGRSTQGGGVVQDLHLWNLGEGQDPAPMQITNTGAAFGAEWLGSQSRWEAD